MKIIKNYKCPDGKMETHIGGDPHYVVEPCGANHSEYFYVFDWENLIRWVLSSPKDEYQVYYADEIFRLIGDSDRQLEVNGWHLQSEQKILNQAEEYNRKISVMKEYNWISDSYEKIMLNWRDCYFDVPISPKCKEKRIVYRRYPKSHTVSSFRTPKRIWARTRFENLMNDSLMDYDYDYSPFVTKKGRHTSCEMGWWDDYRRARRSTGWKESGKPRTRTTNKRDFFDELCRECEEYGRMLEETDF